MTESENTSRLQSDSLAKPIAYQRYGRHIVVFLILTLALIIIMNLTVDPYGMHPRTVINALVPYQNGRGTRIGRGESLYHQDYKIVIAGTSRTHDAYDPGHPVFAGKPAFNAGLSKTTIKEVAAVLKYTIEQNPDLETIVLGIDYSLFADRQRFADDYKQSRLDPKRSAGKHAIESVIAPHVTRRSLSALEDMQKGDVCRYTLDGRQAPPIKDDMPPPQGAFRSTLIHYVSSPGLYGSFHYVPDGLGELYDVLAHAASRGITVRCAINCVHADLMECIYQCGVWSDWEEWKRDIVRVIETVNSELNLQGEGKIRLYDFSGFTSFSTESASIMSQQGDTLRWFRDPSHATVDLGNLVLSTLFDDQAQTPNDSFGTHLTSLNIDDHLMQIRTEREQWISQYPDEVEWARGIIQKSLARMNHK